MINKSVRKEKETMSDQHSDKGTPDVENPLVSPLHEHGDQSNRKRPSLLPIQVAGSLLLLGTAIAVMFGSRAAIASMDAKNESKMAVIQKAIAKKEGVDESLLSSEPSSEKTTVVVASDDGSVAKYIQSYDFTTEQLNWAHKHHIKWDNNGNPVDEQGFVVDDPTTPVNEIERARVQHTLDDFGKSTISDLQSNDPQNHPTSAITPIEQLPSETISPDDNSKTNSNGEVQPGDEAPSTIHQSGAGLG